MRHTATAADVAIVGAGIMGLATAERLTAQGLTVVVIDDSGIAGGATGASGGLVRALDLSGRHRSWAAKSLDLFLSRGRHGAWPRLRDDGSLTLLAPGELARAEDAVTELREAGHKADFLDAPEITRRFPALAVPPDAVAVHEPEAGWLPVRETAQALCREAGPGLRLLHTRATGLLTGRAGITGVRTAAGSVSARAVLLAAGVGSTALAASAGVDLPLHTRAVGYCLFQPREAAGIGGLPTVVDRSTGAWLRQWGTGRLVLAGVHSARTHVPADVHRGVPAEEEHRVRSVVRRRCPQLADAPARGGVTAYDAMAPDADGAGGAVRVSAEAEGLVTATGWNGGGFKLAPAAGAYAAARLRELVAR